MRQGFSEKRTSEQVLDEFSFSRPHWSGKRNSDALLLITHFKDRDGDVRFTLTPPGKCPSSRVTAGRWRPHRACSASHARCFWYQTYKKHLLVQASREPDSRICTALRKSRDLGWIFFLICQVGGWIRCTVRKLSDLTIYAFKRLCLKCRCSQVLHWAISSDFVTFIWQKWTGHRFFCPAHCLGPSSHISFLC